jgi:hypothetical protein
MIRRGAFRALAALLAASPALAQNQTGSVSGAGGAGSGAPPSSYLATYWYFPYGQYVGVAGANPGAGSIRCLPGYFTRTVTTSTVGVRITTLSAGGNIQAAIYPNNPATNQPTGTPLVTSASMSTATAAFVTTAAVAQLTGNVIYWFCTNMDNATAAASSANVASHGTANLVGSLGSAGAMNGLGGASNGYNTVATFGTWGDLSAATWAIAVTNSYPLVVLQLGSVP